MQACTLEPSVVNSLVILFVFDKVLQKCHRHVLIDIKYNYVRTYFRTNYF